MLAPVAAAANGGTFNVNADTFAGAIAGALKAKRLSAADRRARRARQIEKLIKELSVDDARRLIADGTISGGMIPKVETCIDALDRGVEGVVILDGKVPHAVLLELFTELGAGTLIHQLSRRELAQACYPLAPGIAAGVALGISDVLAKIVLAAGGDVLTMLSFRSVVGLAFVASWLRFGPKPYADRARALDFDGHRHHVCRSHFLPVQGHRGDRRADRDPVLLHLSAVDRARGVAARPRAAALERRAVRPRGVLSGSRIMIGAHPAGLAFAGVAYALGAACCRTGRAAGHPRLSGRRRCAADDLVFDAVVDRDIRRGLARRRRPGMRRKPTSAGSAWSCVSLATTAGILFVFVSTMRIGPFRTALIMNLEPLTAMILSALLLGEVITPIQGFGSAIMLAALVAFQLWR